MENVWFVTQCTWNHEEFGTISSIKIIWQLLYIANQMRLGIGQYITHQCNEYL